MMERMTMTDKMKPVHCGCGGEAEVLHPSYTHCIVVMCGKCGIKTPYMNSEAEAITAWNRAMGKRTAKVKTVEKPNVYKCSECGQYFHSTAWGSPVMYCSRCGCRLIWGEDDE